MIFDPTSSLLLAERDITVASLAGAPQYPVGTAVRSELYLTSVVDSITVTS